MTAERSKFTQNELAVKFGAMWKEGKEKLSSNFRAKSEGQNPGIVSSDTKADLPKSGNIFSRPTEKQPEADPKLGVDQLISSISDRIKSPDSPHIDISLIDIDISLIDIESLDQLFTEGSYDKDLNAHLVTLKEEEANSEKIGYTAIKIPKNNIRSRPLLHKEGKEVVFPITGVRVDLGDVSKNEDGDYKRNTSGEVIVDKWYTIFDPIFAEPGEMFEIPPNKAHQFTPRENHFYGIIVSPPNHFKAEKNVKEIDREWTASVSYKSTF